MATVSNVTNPDEAGRVEVMPMGNFDTANYDVGFYNTGVRPTAEDVGRGGLTPFGSPLSYSRQAVIKGGLVPESPEIGFLNFDPAYVPVPGCVQDPFGDPPRLCPSGPIARVAVDGAFKVPTLRNVELTGPYFHNGGHLTLRQTIDFYDRGGDFHEANFDNLSPGVRKLNLTEAEVDSLVDFLLALTDERVRWEKAPFDHPELPLGEGHTPAAEGNPKRHGGTPLPTRQLLIPAVGAAGRASEGLGPLRPYLWDGSDDFHWKP